MPKHPEKKAASEEEIAEANEKAQVAEFLKRVKSVPSDVMEEMERSSGHRGYMKDCMLRPSNAYDSEAVTTNYTYRYQQAMLAEIVAKDPESKVDLRDRLWGPGGPPDMIYKYAETLERLTNFMFDQGDFGGAMRTAARESLTTQMSFIHLIWSEDYHRDPVGAKLFGPQEKNATYRRLHASWKAKEFDQDSNEYYQLRKLSESLKRVVEDKLDQSFQERPVPIEMANMDPRVRAVRQIQSNELIDPKYLPDVPLFQKFEFEVVEFEDVRWDWTITSARDWWQAAWVAHRVRMTSEEATEKFNLTPDEAKLLKTTKALDEGDDTHEHREDIEDNEGDGTIDVWQLQDNRTGRVYVFTESYPGFLDEYEPEVSHSRFFTLFPLQFNEVAGEFVGCSDVDFMRQLQDEINELRTQKKDALRANLPKYGIPAHLVTNDDDLDTIRYAPAFSINKLSINTEELKKSMQEFSANVDLGFFNDNIASATTELQAMGGRPLAAIGAAQKGITATQTAFTNEQLGNVVGMRRLIMSQLMRDVTRAMQEMMLQTMDELHVRAIVGDGAVWPSEGRETLFMQMNTKVTAHLQADPGDTQYLSKLTTLIQLGQAVGIAPTPQMLVDIAKEHIGIDVPFEKWMPVPVQPMQGNAANPTPGPAQGVPGQPQSQVPGMESLPGNAQVAQGIAEQP